MITCECGVEYPYPALEQVFCRNGVVQVGYDELQLTLDRILPANSAEVETCPCPCYLAAETQEDT